VGNQTTIRLSSIMQVTPSPVTVTLTKLLWHNQHRDFASGEERSTGG
jgi:hypothetical protein